MSSSGNHSRSHQDHAGHSHGLSHDSELAGVSDARLVWSVVLNQLLTVGEVAAGFYSGSVALLSDAAHNFNDANALLITWIARKISRKSANERYTFGYRRAELIGAVINLTLLAAIGVYLIYEGVSRFIAPQEIMGGLMAAASLLALIVDVATAILLWSMSQGSLNVKTAFVHNLVDALGSVAVLIGAGAIIYLDWQWIDPALTLMIAGYVLWQVITMLPQAATILMEGAPDHLDLESLIDDLGSVDSVEDVHHVHVWQLDEQHQALEAHIVIPREASDQLDEIKMHLKRKLSEEFGIEHSTLEFEFPDLAGEKDHSTAKIGHL